MRGENRKCQRSGRKARGIMVVRQSFCPASADGCFGTSRHSPRLLNGEITSLLLNETSFERTWEIRLFSFWSPPYHALRQLHRGTTKCLLCSACLITTPGFIAFCKYLHGGWITPKVNLHNDWLHFQAKHFQPFPYNSAAVQKNFPWKKPPNKSVPFLTNS